MFIAVSTYVIIFEGLLKLSNGSFLKKIKKNEKKLKQIVEFFLQRLTLPASLM